MSKLSYQEKEISIKNKIERANLNGHKFTTNEINTFRLFLDEKTKDSILDEDSNKEIVTNGMTCFNCGKNVPIHVDSGEFIVGNQCGFIFQDFEVEVDFSSGKIVNADYLVTIADHIDRKATFGYSQTYKNMMLKLANYASNKVFFPSIPNGQPSLYGENGNYTLVEGTDNQDEDVISWKVIKPTHERLGCFFIDYEKALKMKEAFDILEEDFEGFDDINELDIIEVPKGIYKCTVVKEAMFNRDHGGIFIVGTMKII